MEKKEQEERWVQVDAYCVPSSEEIKYRKEREELAKKTTDFFETFSHHTSRDWAGSQDGEAILGLDHENNIIAMIHLDPDGIDLMHSHPDTADFEQALLDYNEISPDRYAHFLELKEEQK